MFLDSGRKPEYPERTHPSMGRTYKLYTEKLRQEVEPGTILLWDNSPNHHTSGYSLLNILFQVFQPWKGGHYLQNHIWFGRMFFFLHTNSGRKADCGSLSSVSTCFRCLLQIVKASQHWPHPLLILSVTPLTHSVPTGVNDGVMMGGNWTN